MDDNQPQTKTQPDLSEGQAIQLPNPVPSQTPPNLEGQQIAAQEKPAGAVKSGRVLLVEDDPTMVKMYSTKLRLEGFEVEVAYDGEEGLKKINEWLPDLVVLDLMIPKVGGMDVLEQLRSWPKTKNLPVVILSNLSQEQDIQRSHQLGVKEFLIKANFTPGQVVEKIKSFIR